MNWNITWYRYKDHHLSVGTFLKIKIYYNLEKICFKYYSKCYKVWKYCNYLTCVQVARYEPMHQKVYKFRGFIWARWYIAHPNEKKMFSLKNKLLPYFILQTKLYKFQILVYVVRRIYCQLFLSGFLSKSPLNPLL